MEISLSPELMALFEKLIGTITKVQFQYMAALIPALVFFVIYLFIFYKPLSARFRVWWHTRQLSKSVNGSVIRLVHSQPASLLDIFKMPMISLDDSYKVLQALRDTPSNKPIHLVLHTPGGMVIAAEQIARALKAHRGETHAYIPQYAMSGGTLVALACSKIHLGRDALLGPLDPQLQIGLFDQYPCASLVKALAVENANRDDKTLVYGDVAKKAIVQMKTTVAEILGSKIGDEKATELAGKLCDGNWTHDYGINYERACSLGIPVDNDLPDKVYKIADALPSSASAQYRKPKKDNGATPLRITL